MSQQSKGTNLIWLCIHLLHVLENISKQKQGAVLSLNHPSTSPFSRSLVGYLLLLTTAASGLQANAVLIGGAVNVLRSLAAFGVTLLYICTSHPWENLAIGELLVLRMCMRRKEYSASSLWQTAWVGTGGKKRPIPAISLLSLEDLLGIQLVRVPCL